MRNLDVDPEKTLNLLTRCNGLKTDVYLQVLDPYRVPRF